jgi:hypothetical protein
VPTPGVNPVKSIDEVWHQFHAGGAFNGNYTHMIGQSIPEMMSIY